MKNVLANRKLQNSGRMTSNHEHDYHRNSFKSRSDEPEFKDSKQSSRAREDPESSSRSQLRGEITDEYSFYCHGHLYKFSKNSLGCIPNSNIFRKKVVWLITWRYFDYFIIFLIVTNSILLGLYNHDPDAKDSWTNKLVEESENIYTALFTTECILKVVGMGLIKGENSYLKDAWNWLDFSVVITGILTLILQSSNVSVLRTFRIFRPLRSLSALPSMRVLVGTLLASLTQLGGILSMALFFFLIFAILGVSLFDGALHYRCRDSPHPFDGQWNIAQQGGEFDTRLCDPTGQARTCGDNAYCGSYMDVYLKCQFDQYETMDEELRQQYCEFNDKSDTSYKDDNKIKELNFGLTNFKHLGFALYTIFQCITLEGWTNIMYIFQDAYLSWFVIIYFVFLVVICSFFLINLTVAVMLGKYEELDKKEDSDKHKDQLRRLGDDIGMPRELTEYLVDNNNIELKDKKAKKKGFKKNLKSFYKNFIFAHIKVPDESYYTSSRITRFCFHVVMNPLFNSVIMLIIIVNTCLLATDKYPELDEDTQYIFSIINYVFTFIFTIEVIMKLIGVGFKQFIQERFNIFDTFIVVISLVEIAISKDKGSLSALRAFRLMRIFKIFRAENLRILINSIAFTLTTIGNYFVLLILFIYIYALLGTEFFSYKLRYDPVTELATSPDDPNGVVPRNNFDDILTACRTVFAVMIGDDWHLVMYKCVMATSWVSAIYLITLILFGNIIMLNLFLAILLGNFDASRKFHIKLRAFDLFQKHKENGKKLSLTLKFLLGEQEAKYVVEKVIKDKKFKQEFQDLENQERERARLKQEKKEAAKRVKKGFRRYFTEGKPNSMKRGESQQDLPSNNQDNQYIPNLKSKGEDVDSDRGLIDLEYRRRTMGSVPGLQQHYRSQQTANDRPNFISSILHIKQQQNLQPSSGVSNSHLEQINEEDDQQRESEDYKKKITIGTFDSQSQANQGESFDYFKEDTWWYGIVQYLKKSSICIFHRSWKIRQACRALAIQPPKTKKTTKDLNSGAINFVERHKTFQTLNDLRKQGGLTQKQYAKYFENFILVTILLSSILIGIDNPLNDPDSTKQKVIRVIDSIFTFIFLLEALIKIIALGFYFGETDPKIPEAKPYIRSAWNILDFVVVVASMIDFIVILTTDTTSSKTNTLKALKALRALRVLRALRPLRMISRNEGLKLVVNSLLNSIPSMTNVMLVCTLFLMIFAITGINFFKGKFYYCEISQETCLKQNGKWIADECTLLDEVITKEDCLIFSGRWVNNKQNFDNIAQASSVLFQMMSTEGWQDIMWSGINAVGVNKQPKYNHNPIFSLYFILYILIGSQFIKNLFVGVVIDNFNKIKDQEEIGSVFVTDSQRDWIQVQRLMMTKVLKIKDKVPQGETRKFFFKMVNHRFFDRVITMFIFMNTIVMAIRYYGMSPTYSLVLDVLNYIFAFIFNVEAFCKIMGLGKMYFAYSWNRFDFFIVIATDIGLLFTLINFFDISSAATVVRGVRIMRVFRLMKSAQNIRIILDTLVNILPQIGNVMSLIFLLLYIFSVLGVSLFSGVKLQDELNLKANFQTIGSAILTLLRCATGEGWNVLMIELANKEDCLEDQTFQEQQTDGIRGCGTSISYLYFICFTLIISMIIMNLTVAAVIEGLESARKENSGVIQSADIEKLVDLWQDYDTEATGWITVNDLAFYLYELPPPFKLRDELKLYNYDDDNMTMADKFKHQVRGKSMFQDVSINDLQKNYLIKQEKNICLSKGEAIRLLKFFQFPIYQNNKVHFKDVCTILVQNIFQVRDIDIKLGENIDKKLSKHWKRRYKILKKEKQKPLMTVALTFAGGVIAKWLKIQKRNIINRRKIKLSNSKTKEGNNLTGEEKKTPLEKMQEITSEGRSLRMQNIATGMKKVSDGVSYDWMKGNAAWIEEQITDRYDDEDDSSQQRSSDMSIEYKKEEKSSDLQKISNRSKLTQNPEKGVLRVESQESEMKIPYIREHTQEAQTNNPTLNNSKQTAFYTMDKVRSTEEGKKRESIDFHKGQKIRREESSGELADDSEEDKEEEKPVIIKKNSRGSPLKLLAVKEQNPKRKISKEYIDVNPVSGGEEEKKQQRHSVKVKPNSVLKMLSQFEQPKVNVLPPIDESAIQEDPLRSGTNQSASQELTQRAQQKQVGNWLDQ